MSVESILPGNPLLRVAAIVGPTGVGKSAVAEDVALSLRGEIVSADSMQVYRGMDIGTAKVPISERRVPYHCIDLVAPGATYSAAVFQRDARRAIASCASRDVPPVVCGGTGLYVRAALDDLTFADGAQSDNTVRERYERIVSEQGPDALHTLLAERDPAAAAAIHPHNVRRVVRALEMHERGDPYGRRTAGLSRRQSIYDTVFVGLTMERARLYALIDERVDAMCDGGLIDEVRTLLAMGFRTALTSAQAIGYKELVPVVEGYADLDDAVDAIKRATRRYAKRQLTWFRADPRISWVDVTHLSHAERSEAVLAALHWSQS